MGVDIERAVRDAARMTTARSGGPGGQNVNKVNTRVTLHIRLADLPLTDAELARLRERLSSRITGAGELAISSSDSRSQLRNREIAVARAVDLIRGAIRRRKGRRPTRPTRSSVERRIDRKKRHAAKKRDRRSPDP